MQVALSNSIGSERDASTSSLGAGDLALALTLLVGASLLFAVLFNRESALSYSIGYNLYGAERVLEGEVPYRDFHTLYPPATVYLNAAIFKWFGISLYSALFVVSVFKVLTTVALFVGGRLLMARSWAFAAALFSLFWLRPNGPFKAVPMHYGAMFLAVALMMMVLYLKRSNGAYLFIAGLAVGVLALFKHNIGAYALIGFIVALLVHQSQGRIWPPRVDYRAVLTLVAGVLTPVLPVLIYMAYRGALGAMIHTLLLGPGEFLLGRLNDLPSPLSALVFTAWLAAGFYIMERFRSNAWVGAAAGAMTAATLVLLLWLNQSVIDPIVFYLPVIVMLAGLAACLFRKELTRGHRALLAAVLAVAVAAFMEAFPRFAREQVVSAIPFVVLVLFYLLWIFKPTIAAMVGEGVRFRVAVMILPLVFAVMGLRLFASTFLDGPAWKSQTELRAERGRRVLFPASEAAEIDETVAYIQSHVPSRGYFFAHSYAGSAFLFLADRNNPSGAQFWGGVGVSDAERTRTLAELEEKGVHLVITTEKDIVAEKYQPMHEYLEQNFHLAKRIGDTLILERQEGPIRLVPGN